GHVVVEEQRLGARDDEVVDDHRHEVDPDRVEAPQAPGQVDLGAHPVGAGHQHRLAEPRRVEGAQATEPADAAEHLGATRAGDLVPDELDRAVGSVEVHAGVGVADRLVHRDTFRVGA
ncbi:hypothetical protein DF186_14305, partial [Enterococcus hirae]